MGLYGQRTTAKTLKWKLIQEIPQQAKENDHNLKQAQMFTNPMCKQSVTGCPALAGWPPKKPCRASAVRHHSPNQQNRNWRKA
jgi:hypothetical protein